MSLENTGFFILTILAAWVLAALFLGRSHTFLAKKGFSSTKVGTVLVIISIGLFLGYASLSEHWGQKILATLMIAGFLFGVGLIRIDNYKHLYGREWENKKE